MAFVRLLSVVMMLGASLVASGGSTVVQICTMPAAVAAHDCPCAQKERANHSARPELGRTSCCSIERSSAAPLPVATVSPDAASPVFAPAPPIALPGAPASDFGFSLALRDVPRSQGPPVFLKVRSLLI